MTDDMSGDLTGRRLGNYRIDGVLGRGGMSVMYRATDVRLGRKVALKVIGEHLGADAEFRERFVDEARNTSSIDHANVVPLYDFGELDGMLYIAMRLVDGADLASLISNGPLSPSRTLKLLDQVADALDSLHQRGLIHLDVKPANVLVTSRESIREHVYLADFGLTRRGATGHRTRGGDFLGSPTYAAPEHLRGESLDGRTDQYALACVFYACLTGGPPYPGEVPAVIKGHLAGEPPAISRKIAVPPAIDEVVRRGMAKRPQDRYASCGELITAARRALGPLAMSETPISSRDQDDRNRDAQRTGASVTGPVGAQTGHGLAHGPGHGPSQGSAGHAGQGYGVHGPGVSGVPGQMSQMHAGQSQPGRPNQPAHGQPNSPAGYGYGNPQNGPGFSAMPPRPHSFSPGTPGMPGAPGVPQQGMQQHYGSAGEPMRLRAPAPAGSSASFSSGRNSASRSRTSFWIFVALGVAALAGIIVAAILLFGSDSGSGPNPPAPAIPIGSVNPGNQQPQQSTGTRNALPPSSIPIQPP